MNPRKALSKLTLQDWIFLIFSLFWMGIIMLDYLNKQIIYLPSIIYFKYFNLFIFLGVIGALISASYNRIGVFKKIKALPVNGLVILFLFFLIVCSITLSFNKYWRAPLDYTNYLHLIGKGLFTLGMTYILIVGVYCIGNRIRNLLVSDSNPRFTFILLDICIGFIIYTMILMVLGAFMFLNQYVLWVIMAVFIATNYRQGLSFIHTTLWRPIPKPRDLNFIGGFLAFFILVYVTMNYFYTQSPFPLGFDARNYYVNISRLIADAGGLVPGFQPYAWGLVMSTGYIAFNSPEITLFISALGGILSLFAIYHFCSYYLKIPSNSSLLVVLLYLVTPTVTNHFIIEFKVDLTLVFFQLVIVSFFMWWIFESKLRTSKRETLLDSKSDYNSIILIGILLGYCLSIKVLSVFLVFGLFLGIWWYHRDVIGVISLCALSLGIILLAELDRLSGLRDYHLSPEITGRVLFILGTIGLIYSIYKYKAKSLSSLKIMTLCGLFIFITFSPWMYKNYSFTKSTSLTKLLMGDKPRPDLQILRYNKSEGQSPEIDKN